jgi:2-methylcitrate dehydratase PrpD
MRRTAIFNTVHPENEVAARASLPYCLAVAVCKKDPASLLGPAFRKELLQDKAIRSAAEKVRITENEEYERKYPAQSLARVTITLNNGKSFTQEEDRSARGRYLTPTDDDIEHKFRLIAKPVLGAAKTDKVIALVRRLETLPDISELVQALRP